MSGSWAPGPRRVPGSFTVRNFHKKLVVSANFGDVRGAVFRPSQADMEHDGLVSTMWTPESGESILLSLRWQNKPGVLIDLGALTEDELSVLERFMLKAIQKARPIAKERDRIAREAEENGDYSLARSNRADPKLVVKPGEE